eukprot:scaffold2385_cov178-Amphora_coffeaeformis.AAC.1
MLFFVPAPTHDHHRSRNDNITHAHTSNMDFQAAEFGAQLNKATLRGDESADVQRIVDRGRRESLRKR